MVSLSAFLTLNKKVEFEFLFFTSSKVAMMIMIPHKSKGSELLRYDKINILKSLCRQQNIALICIMN